MNKKTNRIINIFIVAIVVVGVGLILYPFVSDYWNTFRQSRAISTYNKTVAALSDEDYEKFLADAKEYNRALASNNATYFKQKSMADRYGDLLNLSGNGIMAYIDIPKINCSLPIYHTTNEAVLQVAVGHLDWSSLPTGGKSTHCVVSGHTGLPSANLFTDIDKLEIGDTFTISVLNEVLTYQVDQKIIVDPDDTEELQIVKGEDYCSLVTCYPYAVNTHRLIVRGKRIESMDVSDARIVSDAEIIDPIIIFPVVMIPMLGIYLIFILFGNKKSRNKEG